MVYFSTTDYAWDKKLFNLKTYCKMRAFSTEQRNRRLTLFRERGGSKMYFDVSCYLLLSRIGVLL